MFDSYCVVGDEFELDQFIFDYEYSYSLSHYEFAFSGCWWLKELITNFFNIFSEVGLRQWSLSWVGYLI